MADNKTNTEATTPVEAEDKTNTTARAPSAEATPAEAKPAEAPMAEAPSAEATPAEAKPTEATPAESAEQPSMSHSEFMEHLFSLPDINKQTEELAAAHPSHSLALLELLQVEDVRKDVDSKLGNGSAMALRNHAATRLETWANEHASRRLETLSDTDTGVGAYVGLTPGGTYGLEAGFVHRSEESGNPVVFRSGFGCYIRSARVRRVELTAEDQAKSKELGASLMAMRKAKK